MESSLTYICLDGVSIERQANTPALLKMMISVIMNRHLVYFGMYGIS